MDETIFEERSEKSQFLERLSICLRIIAVVSLVVGVYLLLTNSVSSSNSSSMSYGMQQLTDIVPYLIFGVISIISLICLVVAFVVRKYAPILALFLLVCGISMPIVAWLYVAGQSQIQIVPVSH